MVAFKEYVFNQCKWNALRICCKLVKRLELPLLPRVVSSAWRLSSSPWSVCTKVYKETKLLWLLYRRAISLLLEHHDHKNFGRFEMDAYRQNNVSETSRCRRRRWMTSCRFKVTLCCTLWVSCCTGCLGL